MPFPVTGRIPVGVAHIVLFLALSVPSTNARAQTRGDDERADDDPRLLLERPLRPGEQVQFTMENGDLMDLVSLMTRVTGRRFIVTGRTRELTATVTSSQPVTAGEAYRAFVAILHHNGLTLVREGAHYVITDSEGVERRPLPVVTDATALPADERYVTWVHRLSHVALSDAVELLSGLMSADGHVVTHAPTSTLIVIDTGASIRRLRQLLAEVDVAHADAHLWVERLEFADAEASAEQIRTVFGVADESGGGGETPRPARRARPEPAQPNAAEGPSVAAVTGARAPDLYEVLPEPRSNALIIVATRAGYRRVIALLRELDRPEGTQLAVRVRRLQHGDATEVATTLTEVLGGGGGGGANREGATLAGISSAARISAHEDLNALVITASPSEFATIEALVRDLDVAPRQVFLEMVLLELSVDHSEDVGTNVLSGLGDLFGGAAGLVATGGAGAVTEELLTGLAIGITGPTITDPRLPGGSLPSFGVLLQALASSTQADIVTEPRILTLDHREAEINVGENVPLQGSSVPGFSNLLTAAGQTDAATTAAASALTQSSASGGRRDTGTIIRVTPHISDNGSVRLEIEAEDSRVGSVAEGNLNAVSLLQSITTTELSVEDGETAVIGGLVRYSRETVHSGVPGLSEIPIIGALFGTTHEHTVRRNLLFFVTPHIVNGRDDLRAIFERRMRERRELHDRHVVFEGPWEPPIDYDRTRGLVAEMLDRIDEVHREAERAGAAPSPGGGHPLRPPIDLDAAAAEATSLEDAPRGEAPIRDERGEPAEPEAEEAVDSETLAERDGLDT